MITLCYLIANNFLNTNTSAKGDDSTDSCNEILNLGREREKKLHARNNVIRGRKDLTELTRSKFRGLRFVSLRFGIRLSKKVEEESVAV